MTLKQYELEEVIQDYASQARAVLTSQLGLETEDDSLDDIIEEEFTNMVLSLLKYDYDTIKEIVDSPDHVGLTKQEIIEHLGLEESLIEEYEMVLNKLEELELEDVAFWEDLDVHVEDTGFEKIYFGVGNEVVAFGIKTLESEVKEEFEEELTEEDLMKKLNEKTIKADKLDVIEEGLYSHIVAVSDKKTVYGTVLATGTLRQLAQFLLAMAEDIDFVSMVEQGLYVVKYFNTETGEVRNYLVERKW